MLRNSNESNGLCIRFALPFADVYVEYLMKWKFVSGKKRVEISFNFINSIANKFTYSVKIP
jgi:hypothetical protein